MGPPVRERYNSKARQSTVGGSSHKKRKRGNKEASQAEAEVEPWNGFDSNAEILPEDKERKRIESMRKQLVPEDQPMSSKKRKRLDSYIAKKLKQESRLESLSLLAKHALPAHLPGSLKSTSTLGQNPTAPLSAQEMAAKKEDLNVRRALDRQGSKGVGMYDEEESEGEEEDAAAVPGSERDKVRMAQAEKRRTRHGLVEDMKEEAPRTVVVQSTINTSAKKHRSGGKQAAWSAGLISTQPEPESDFDSSDSANDSSSSEDEQEDEGVPAPPIAPKQEATAEDARTSSEKKQAPSSSTTKPLKPAATTPAPRTGFGSALARDPSGAAAPIKVVVREKKFKNLSSLSAEQQKLLAERRAMLDAMVAEEEESDVDDKDDDDDEVSDGAEGSEESGEEDESGDEDDDDDDEDDQEEDESDDESEPESDAPQKAKRAANFKAWALKQTDAALAPDLLSQNKPFTDKPSTNSLPHVGPLAGIFNVPSTSLLSRDAEAAPPKRGPRPAITRRPSVIETRSQLPVVAEEQSIMEAIQMNPVVIICGETGSGKTTQVPQMLYEAGFGFPGSENPGMIAITQPRRVAAVSLSVRVASELNMSGKTSVVAHQIRYQSTTSPSTAIKFMTDGVLLRELAQDFLLKRYSVVIVDEAHERGVNTDVLVGVLSRVAKLRETLWREKKDGVRPLRIVIMSATLRVSDFAENKMLFATTPPIIHIGARQHPVTTHFSRRTTHDYVNEAYKKVAKIHARLPMGGILVFLTGQGEITSLCRKLERRYGKAAIEGRKAKTSLRDEAARRWENGEEAATSRDGGKNAAEGNLELEDLDLGIEGDDLAGDVDDGDPEEDPEALDSDDDDEDIDERLGIDKEQSETPLHVLPLYSLLSNEQQLRVFDPPPEGTRLVVVATNVAETSVTIPNIRYVVDSGRAKERQYDASTGVQSFQVTWISKASASQRAGRAGRTGPGHCYRLYSSAVFENHFEAFSQPEILRMPIEGVVLQMKSMNIDTVINFPFPTPPDRTGLKVAEKLLTHLGALEQSTATQLVNGVEKRGAIGGKITDLGKIMASFPVTPRFAKMLVIGQQHGCLPYVIAIVAALSVGDPFLREEGMEGGKDEDEEDEIEDVPEMAHINSADIREKEQRKAKRRAFFQSQARYAALGKGASDLFKLLSVVGAYEYAGATAAFCRENFVREKAMKEIHQLRVQLTSIAKAQLLGKGLDWNPKLRPPNDTQLKVIRQIVCAGYIDQVAVRKDLAPGHTSQSFATYTSSKGIPYRAAGIPEDVFIHPSSTTYSTMTGAAEFIVFADLVRTSKVWVKNVTKINPAWLSTLGKSMCTFSRPLEMPSQAIKGKTASDKSGDANVRDVFVVPHFGDLGIALPTIKVKQRKIAGGRWVTEL